MSIVLFQLYNYLTESLCYQMDLYSLKDRGLPGREGQTKMHNGIISCIWSLTHLGTKVQPLMLKI